MHRITSTTEDKSGTIVESDSGTIEHKPLKLLKLVSDPSPNTRIEVKHLLVDLCVVKRTDVGATVETPLTNRMSTTKWQIVMSFQSALKYALESSQFSGETASKP